MTRAYAGTMGYLGMAVTLLRGVKEGAGVEATLLSSVGALIGMAVVGAIVGAIAQATVDEAIRRKLQEALSDRLATQSS